MRRHHHFYDKSNLSPLYICYILLLGLLSLNGALAGGFDHFFNPKFSRAPHYTLSQLYQTNVGLEVINGQIGCFGDFNSDKYTDIFVISKNQSEVILYLWNTYTYKFERSSIELKFDHGKVESLAASDFNHDGKLDLLVQIHPWDYSSVPFVDTSRTDLFVYFGDYNRLYDSVVLPSAFEGQVSLIEYTGDLRPDLLGNTWKDGRLMRTVWINGGDGKMWNLVPFNGDSGLAPLSNPHSTAMVDFDGDCMPDLFMTSNSSLGVVTSEIWISVPSTGKFVKHSNFGAIENVLGQGQVTFGDFDGDGSVDLLFPVCYPAHDCSIENSIHIHYNAQKKICSGLFSKGCRKSTELCSADPNFRIEKFVQSKEVSKSEKNDQKIDQKNDQKNDQKSDQKNDQNIDKLDTDSFIDETKLLSEATFYTEEQKDDLTSSSSSSPNIVILDLGSSNILYQRNSSALTIRIGDYNVDRFPDLLVPVRRAGSSQVSLWKNIPCTEDLCGSQATKAKRRTFSLVTSGTQALSSLKGAFSATWFDMDEDGSLDILAISEPSSGAPIGLTAITNNFFNDGYFVKKLGLNGVCTVNCGIKDISLGRKPYGVNQHGAAWKYTLADLHGTQLVNAVPQLPQSAYSALQTPYVLSGLGRPSNYIDYVYVGVPVYKTGKSHFQSWPGIIPNSQVVVTPYPINNPYLWALELYISPSGALLWIAISVAVCLIISGAGIIFFQWKEKKADEAEKKEKEHLFSFSAM